MYVSMSDLFPCNLLEENFTATILRTDSSPSSFSVLLFCTKYLHTLICFDIRIMNDILKKEGKLVPFLDKDDQIL